MITTVKLNDARKLVRKLRRQKGWSLRQLTAESGIPYSTLSKIENGITNITTDHLRAFASAFGETWKLARVRQ